MGAQAYRDLTSKAFGAQGNVVAAMFGDPSKVKMYQANQDVITSAVQKGDLKTIQDLLKVNTAGKGAQAIARLKNDIIEFGQYGIPIATKFFDTVNPKLKEFGDWIDQHPQDAQKLFDDLFKTGIGLEALGGSLKLFGLGLAVPLGILKTVQAIKMARDLAAIAKSIRVLSGAEAAAVPTAETLAGVGAISAGTIGAVTTAIAAVGELLAGAKYDATHPLNWGSASGYGSNDLTQGSLGNYGLGVASPTYIPYHPGKTTPDISRLKAQVEFILPKAMPKGTKVRVHAHLQSVLGTNSRSTALPRPQTVMGMVFHS